ncbi:ABC transporter permease subunit [Bacillus cereus]|uniref:ABC transporter permease subunit n=1 Tax=Bacillus sp. UNC322MFChir4.1 TaxID=1449045 RepID=UPI00055827E8|nr:ABC transporter permease subunit [Bacillus sp. UNC322MFChir4.1]
MKKILINKFVEIPMHLVLSTIVIFFLGTLPQLFIGMELNVHNYINSITSTFSKLFGNKPLTYYGPYMDPSIGRPLFPQIFIQYKQTAFVFLMSLLISVLVSFIIVYIILQLPKRKQEKIKVFLDFLESIPDILFILGLQLLVVYIYKKTDVLIMNIAGIGDKKVVLLPILCLSLPSIILFVKLLLFRFETELQKDYILLARAKGLGKLHILNHHVLRNVLLSTLYFSKTNIWFMLSNLYIIEYFFNIPGTFLFLKNYGIPEVFIVSMLLIYIPIFIIFKLFHIFIPDELKGEG